jgi:hypothetical protein
MKALEQGHWWLALNIGISIVTYVVDRVFKEKIPRGVLPWVAIGLSIVASFALCMHAGKGWSQSLLLGAVGGFLTGSSASGLWSSLVKYPVKKLKGGGKKGVVTGEVTDGKPEE